MKTAVFLQARLNSNRLPRKALLPLRNGNVIQHTMRALRGIRADLLVLLTDRQSGPALKDFAGEEGFCLFVGPSDDVLERFCRAANYYEVNRIVRATGDNPLVSARMANALLHQHGEGTLELSHFINLPLGTGVEVVEEDVLHRSNHTSSDPYEHEHITTYAYRHPELFRIGHLFCPPEYRLPKARLTLDWEDDYVLISRIYEELYRNRPIEIDELVPWLRQQVVR